jgi:tetratricopeptide (TPR) repeat protein
MKTKREYETNENNGWCSTGSVSDLLLSKQVSYQSTGRLRSPYCTTRYFRLFRILFFLTVIVHSVASQVTGQTGQGPSAAAESRQQQGIHYFKQRNLQKALSEFRAAIELNPKDAISHDYIGVIMGESGMAEAAIPAFQQAIKHNPKFAEAHFHLGLSYDRTGRMDEAIAEYQEALRLKPELAEARYGLSAICVRVGDLSGAIDLLRQVIKAVPNFSEARYNLALNLWNKYKNSTNLRLKSDLDEAVQELLAASRLEPRQPMIHAVLGRILIERQDLERAVEHLRKAVELTPNNPEYRYDLGLALRLKGELEAAEAELRVAINYNPRYGLARRALGLILRQKGDFEGAAAELRISVTELPEDSQGHHLLGTVLLKLNDVNGAIEELRQAIRLDPYLTEAHVNLAQALQKAGQKEEAQREVMESRKIESEKSSVGRAMVLIEKATDHINKGEHAKAVGLLREAPIVSPKFPETHYQLGMALRQSSANEAESEAAFRRVLDLDSGHAVARYQLGLLLRKRGDKLNASFEFRKAAQLAPSLAECYRELGRIALDARDWVTAEAEYKKFLAWEPEDPEAHYDLATALKAQGRLEEAVQELRMAQRLNPADKRHRSRY